MGGLGRGGEGGSNKILTLQKQNIKYDGQIFKWVIDLPLNTFAANILWYFKTTATIKIVSSVSN